MGILSMVSILPMESRQKVFQEVNQLAQPYGIDVSFLLDDEDEMTEDQVVLLMDLFMKVNNIADDNLELSLVPQTIRDRYQVIKDERKLDDPKERETSLHIGNADATRPLPDLLMGMRVIATDLELSLGLRFYGFKELVEHSQWFQEVAEIYGGTIEFQELDMNEIFWDLKQLKIDHITMINIVEYGDMEIQNERYRDFAYQTLINKARKTLFVSFLFPEEQNVFNKIKAQLGEPLKIARQNVSIGFNLDQSDRSMGTVYTRKHSSSPATAISSPPPKTNINTAKLVLSDDLSSLKISSPAGVKKKSKVRRATSKNKGISSLPREERFVKLMEYAIRNEGKEVKDTLSDLMKKYRFGYPVIMEAIESKGVDLRDSRGTPKKVKKSPSYIRALYKRIMKVKRGTQRVALVDKAASEMGVSRATLYRILKEEREAQKEANAVPAGGNNNNVKKKNSTWIIENDLGKSFQPNATELLMQVGLGDRSSIASSSVITAFGKNIDKVRMINGREYKAIFVARFKPNLMTDPKILIFRHVEHNAFIDEQHINLEAVIVYELNQDLREEWRGHFVWHYQEDGAAHASDLEDITKAQSNFDIKYNSFDPLGYRVSRDDPWRSGVGLGTMSMGLAVLLMKQRGAKKYEYGDFDLVESIYFRFVDDYIGSKIKAYKEISDGLKGTMQKFGYQYKDVGGMLSAASSSPALESLPQFNHEFLLHEENSTSIDKVNAERGRLKEDGGDEKLGGIDLTTGALNLKREGRGIDFPMQDINTLNLENFKGFTPVIFQMVPVANFPLLLGVVDVDPPDKERQGYSAVPSYAVENRKSISNFRS